jgi:RsiW-degrading membrane proteinase PrsW (M82 family)
MIIIIELLILAAIELYAAHWLIKNSGVKRKPRHAYLIPVLFGMAITIFGIFFEHFVIPSKFDKGGATKYALIGTLMVGIIEECFKFIPYALFVHKKKYFNHIADGVVLFAMVGLGSAYIEDILDFLSGNVFDNTLRTLIFLFHASTTAVVGYFFARAKLKHESYLKTVLALIFVSVLHGLNDFALGSAKLLLGLAGLVISVGVIKLLFVVYKRAKKFEVNKGKI